MQLFGQGQKPPAVEPLETRHENGQAGDEERRTCGPPGIRIEVPGGDEVREAFLMVAVDRGREMSVRGEFDRCGGEEPEACADRAGQRGESGEVAVRALAQPRKGFLAHSGGAAPARIVEATAARLAAEAFQEFSYRR